MTTITIAEDVRLDLGQTDLVGALVYTGDDLVLVAPSGSVRVLGRQQFDRAPGQLTLAASGHVLIEELGIDRALPAALVATGFLEITGRRSDLSPWGVDVVELRVLVRAEDELSSAAIAATELENAA